MNKFQINLPKTVFSMKANLPEKEIEFLKFWEKINLKRVKILGKERKVCIMMAHHMQMEIYI